MNTQPKPLTIEFEHFPAVEVDAEEIRQQKGKTVLEAVRDLLAKSYPHLRGQISPAKDYDIQLAAPREDGSPCETPLQGHADWTANVECFCDKLAGSLAIAEHVEGGIKKWLL
jgi:hypothetical protein